MNKKRIQLILGILIVVGIAFLMNFIVSLLSIRIDLTQEKRYSLSPTTIELLNSLDEQVYIKIYLAGDQLPVKFKHLQKSVVDLLDEFDIRSTTNILCEVVNPDEIDDKSIRMKLYNQLSDKGLMPVELKENTKAGKRSSKIIFPGAVILYKDNELAVNLLKNNPALPAEVNLNNSIQSLEYEFVNALTKLSNEKKQKIAFTRGHDELPVIFIEDMARSLTEYYNVDRVFINDSAQNLNEFQLLFVVKPKKQFSEKEKYILDQYIMNGGKVIWMIEGVQASMDSLQHKPSFIAMPNTLNLEDQLFNYGVRINPVLIEDLQCSRIGIARPGPSGKPEIKLFPWQFSPLILANQTHPVTKYLNVIKCDFASQIDTVGKSSEIQKTVLLRSSKYSKATPTPLPISLKMIDEIDESAFKPGNHIIGVLLEGAFQSVFKNRMLAQFTSQPEKFRSKSSHTNMVVIADGDIIKNDVSSTGEMYPLGYDRHTKHTFSGNKEFFMNLVNYLCDDKGLMMLRSREIKLRLLNKDEITENKLVWQLINVILPIVIILLTGILIHFRRKLKYKKTRIKV